MTYECGFNFTILESTIKNMRLKLLTISGTIIFLVPLSQYILWIIAANQGGSQTESVSIFLSFFPDFIQNTNTITLYEIAFCCLAILATSFSRKIQGRWWNILNLFVLVMSSILLFLNIFSLM